MRAALKAEQRPDGHWLFELEADATIPAEYIFLQHFLGKVDTPGFRAVEPKIANHLRAIQGRHGGWPLFHDGDIDVSASVKAYFALKLAGDDPEAPHMQRARAAILAAGRSEEHTSELQSLMRTSSAVFCLKTKKKKTTHHT